MATKDANKEKESGKVRKEGSGGDDKIESNKHLATPAVRNLIKTHNIEITSVAGTGKDGRVLK